MALTDDCGMNTTMLVSPAGNVGTPYPVYMNGGGASGNNAGSNFGGDGWWIILLFILLSLQVKSQATCLTITHHGTRTEMN